MKLKTLLAASLLSASICCLSAPGFAQVESEAPAEKSPMTVLSDALAKAAKGKVTLSGKLVDRSENGGAGAGAMVVIGGMGGKKNKFFGKFEAQVQGRQVFVCTEKALPGISAMRLGRKTLVRKTESSKDPIDAGYLSSDALQLLDFQRLSKEVARAERRAAEGKKKRFKVKSADDGSHTLNVAIRTSMLASPGNDDNPMASMMRPKILGIDAEFALDAKGQLRSMRLTVTRSDPMAAIRKRAMAGGGQLEISDPSDLEDDDPEEGAKTEFTFELRDGPLSKRALGAQKSLASLFER